MLNKTNFLEMVKNVVQKIREPNKKNYKILRKVSVFNSASYDITYSTHTVLATYPG